MRNALSPFLSNRDSQRLTSNSDNFIPHSRPMPIKSAAGNLLNWVTISPNCGQWRASRSKARTNSNKKSSRRTCVVGPGSFGCIPEKNRTKSRNAPREAFRSPATLRFQNASEKSPGRYSSPYPPAQIIPARNRKSLVCSKRRVLKLASLQIRVMSVLLGSPPVFGRTRPESNRPAMARCQYSV